MSKKGELSLTTTGHNIFWYCFLFCGSVVQAMSKHRKGLGLRIFIVFFISCFPMEHWSLLFSLNLEWRSFLTGKTMTATHTGITVYTNTTTIAKRSKRSHARLSDDFRKIENYWQIGLLASLSLLSHMIMLFTFFWLFVMLLLKQLLATRMNSCIDPTCILQNYCFFSRIL